MPDTPAQLVSEAGVAQGLRIWVNWLALTANALWLGVMGTATSQCRGGEKQQGEVGGMQQMGCELESEFRYADTSDAVAIEGFGWVQGAWRRFGEGRG